MRGRLFAISSAVSLILCVSLMVAMLFAQGAVELRGSPLAIEVRSFEYNCDAFYIAFDVFHRPFWILTLRFPSLGLFIALPALWLVRRRPWRMLRRVDHSRCARCGYDLRATPGRCPECGTIPKAART